MREVYYSRKGLRGFFFGLIFFFLLTGVGRMGKDVH